MCLLIFKPANKSIPFSFLQNAENDNPDGTGVAIATGDKIIIEKSAKWGAKEAHLLLEQHVDKPAIVHFRFATHGSKNSMNTHPFVIDENWVGAHNGVIGSVSCGKDESDSRAFLRQYVKPLVTSGVRLDDKDIVAYLADEMGSGNKMVYLHRDGSVGIPNESSGHWKDGVWYSNHSYEVSRYDYDGYHTSYYGGSFNHSYKPTTTAVDKTVETWLKLVAPIKCDYCDCTIKSESENMHIDASCGLVLCSHCYNS